MGQLNLLEQAAPTAPAAGVSIYPTVATPSVLRWIDDAGVDRVVVGGTSGAWTPTIAGDSVAGSHTYTTRVGNYVKLGPFVLASFYIVVNAKDGATAGNLLITGLPFASKNTASLFQGGGVPLWGTLATSVVHLGIYTLPNTTTAALVKTTAAAASTGALVAADIQNASSLLGFCAYEATS